MKRLFPLFLFCLSLLRAESPDRPELYELARHLYRWYLDESHISDMIAEDEVVFYVRDVQRELDEGDNSQVSEVLLGGTGFGATLKKADYEIPELNVKVKSDVFKVTNVFTYPAADEKDASFTRVSVPYREMIDFLFKNRNDMTFPDDAMLDRLRDAVGTTVRDRAKARNIEITGGPEVLHLAAVSPVANEMWVFWERGRILIRYASDFDLESDAAWQHPQHALTVYDLTDQVVVSLHEAPGSNAYITRDKAGRALFNCVVLGKRISIVPRPTE